MSKDCIICKQNLKVGETVSEGSGICMDCYREGYRVCESDKKIFKKSERIEHNFTLDNVQTFIIEKYDLLESVAKEFGYMDYEKKVCSSKCFNVLYLDKCIEEIQGQVGMLFLEQNIFKFKSLIDDKEKQEKFKMLAKNKINELENYKQKYL